MYRVSSESMSQSSLSKGSSESVSVISLVEKPSQQLGPTGEKFSMQSPKSSQTQAVVVEAQPGEEIAKLRESWQRAQEELKVEKEKSATFEEEFASLQSNKVKVEQERSELEIQLEDVKRENERAVEELNQKIEDFERENKRYSLS